MAFLKPANLTLAFLLELCMLAALGAWGFRVGQDRAASIGLGLGVPVLAAVFWGVFLSPKAALRLSAPAKYAAKAAVFGCAVLALAATGLPGLAWTFGLLVALNLILLYVWRQ